MLHRGLESAEAPRRKLLAVGLCVCIALACAPNEDERPVRVIAHRGASAYAPENTLPAFRRALELGTEEVELDAQLSRDGVVVAFHDRSLERKTSGRGRVRDHEWEALRALEIGTWFDAAHPEASARYAGTRLASLAEIFAAARAGSTRTSRSRS